MKDYVDIRVRVPIEMHERMERQAKAEYSNISEVTRRLWVGYLEKNEQEKPRCWGFFFCGAGTASCPQ